MKVWFIVALALAAVLAEPEADAGADANWFGLGWWPWSSQVTRSSKPRVPEPFTRTRTRSGNPSDLSNSNRVYTKCVGCYGSSYGRSRYPGYRKRDAEAKP